MAKKPRKRNKKKKGIFHKIIKYLFLTIILFIFLLFIFITCVYYGMWGPIPDYKELREIKHYEASSLYSEDGELLGKYYIENRTNVMFDSISRNAINALIATEDVRFYEHKGFDRISMLRVIFKTVLLGKKSSGGGSTISQQLAKNLFPRNYKSSLMMPVIKIKEIITAHRLEKIYSKDEILTLYLNTVFFGEQTFGIESAAQKFFSTTATHLTIPEAATLIGLLKGPSYYNPRIYPERTLERRNTVISQMVKYDFLSEENGEKYKETELKLRFKPLNHYSGLTPYLREQIRKDALKILAEYNEEHSENYDLYRDGLIIKTTINAELQRYAEEAMRSHMKDLQDSFYTHFNKKEPWANDIKILDKTIKESQTYKNLKAEGLSETDIMAQMGVKKPMVVYSSYEGEIKDSLSSIDSIKHYLKILQPGVIAVEPHTGKVKVWIGGADFKYFQYDQVLAPRQVGSVFKPVIYSAAIQRGAKIDTYYPNEQKTYPDYQNWTPRNSNNEYGGYYTLRGALSQSINTIAVDVLLQNGIDYTIEHARQLGLTSDLPEVPSLALGVANIPLNEMILPYLIYANNGRLVEPYYLLEIKDRKGNVIYEAPKRTPDNVLPADVAHLMSSFLTDVIKEGTGRRLNTRYGLNLNLAGKTGTTQNNTDGWFIGYNPRIVVGVRVGANNPNIHFNSTALGQGANTALPIFGLFMQKCLNDPNYSNWANLSFPIPAEYKTKELEAVPYKEELNLLERITKHKIENVDKPAKIEKEMHKDKDSESKEGKGLFRKIGNVFKKKDKNK